MKRALLTFAVVGSLGMFLMFGKFLIPLPPMLWVLSVGQGESVLYYDPVAGYLLYDGGPDDTVLSELGRILPPWQRQLSQIVLSHTHADHIRGLIAVLKRYQVKEVWSSGTKVPSPDYSAWLSQIGASKAQIRHPIAGEQAIFGTTTVETLFPVVSQQDKSPLDAHDATLVIRLHNATGSVLLAGDLAESHERAILKSCAARHCTMRSDVLQVPHHGSGYGLAASFLSAINPRFAFIPVGQRNRYKHPHAPTLQKLESAKIPYHRTDTQGGLAIRFLAGKLVMAPSGAAPR
jgi:competence protein ComEC